jgi:hypothetical protein
MRNIVPVRSLTRRSRTTAIIALLLFLTGLLFLLVSVVMRSVPFVVPASPDYDLYVTAYNVLPIVGGLLMMVALALAIRVITWKQDNPLALAIGDVLDAELDDRYIYIRNVSKFSLGYIDAVLVGPPGVLVFRITERAGVFKNEGSYWMKQKEKGDWKTLRWSPTREAVDDVKSLREYLETKNQIDVPVYAAVVFTEDTPATTVRQVNPTVPVLQPAELPSGLADTYFARTDRLRQLKVNKIARLLYE